LLEEKKRPTICLCADITASSGSSFQRELEEELERLKKLLKTGYELRVIWTPNSKTRISGEVRGTTIHVYDTEREVALETLKHELIDYSISKIIEPYKEIANKLISLINEDAYKRKETLVEALGQILE